MAENEFIFNINGTGVSPATVDVADLATALVLLRRSILATAKIADAKSEDIHLSLVNIKEGSDSLTLQGSDLTIRTTELMTLAVASRQTKRLPREAVASLYKLREFIEWKEWDSCSFESNGSKIAPLTISVDDDLFADAQTYSGATVIYGECLRVGGDPRLSAFMRLADGSKRAVRLKNKDLAQQLGQRLYQTVGLSGVATWRADDRYLLKFVADALLPYSDRDRKGVPARTMTEAFSNLSRAAGARWDDVDADEFVQEQRRD